MPLYNLDVQKKAQGEYFTNRYILEGAGISSLATAATAIWQAEQAIMLTSVEFVSYRLSDNIPKNDLYIVVAIGQNGLRADGGQAMPLFNCARVDFSVGIGRPSRKYLRGSVVEGDQSAYGVLNQAYVDFVNENYTAYLVALTEYVDVDGQAITGGACIPTVAMRQLRRGSKRKLQPIIPVS